jgi:hypothetical protein
MMLRVEYLRKSIITMRLGRFSKIFFVCTENTGIFSDLLTSNVAVYLRMPRVGR